MKDSYSDTLEFGSARLLKVHDAHGDVVGEFVLPDGGLKVKVEASTYYPKFNDEFTSSFSKTSYYIRISTKLGVGENGRCLTYYTSPKQDFTPEEVEAAKGLLSKGEDKVGKLLKYLAEQDEIDD